MNRLCARWTHLHLTFLAEFGRQLTMATGDVRETAFLFQRLNVSVAQWANTLSEPQYLLGLSG